MAPYEALYSRKCRTPLYWTELNKKQIHGVDLVRKTEEKVKAKVLRGFEKKKIEFHIGDKVFLKVSPWKKVLRFGQKGKLSSSFIGPYEVIEKIGPVAYRLALPTELEKIHNVFMCLCYGEPIKILAREVKQMRNKSIAQVKVLWQRHSVEEATWEPEEAV
ncbi:Retrotransposable element Tf2 protein type 1 [Gossypium australe]|uniref:Retrotransposable element Tf2 protein type 1 n=1 Tax=Gossypium australe TaxID=47621 RepID=A0A5B6WHI7_9ROSI|nr:Retrotransposable element Tf2 protein type 1 [Gossypium australe]